MATLLRVSDVLRLKKSDVYDERGRVKKNAYLIDKKTKKPNTLYLNPIRHDLETYYDWLKSGKRKIQLKRFFTVLGSFLPLSVPRSTLMSAATT